MNRNKKKNLRLKKVTKGTKTVHNESHEIKMTLKDLGWP